MLYRRWLCKRTFSLLRRSMLRSKFLMLFAALTATGCMTEGQFLASRQTTAMEVAVSRGQSEMNCPGATGEMLSKEFTQAVQTPIVQAGIQRAIYDRRYGLRPTARLSGFLRDAGRQLHGACRRDAVS